MEEKKCSGIWWIYSEDNQNSNRVHGTLSISREGNIELIIDYSASDYSLECKGNHNYTIWGVDGFGMRITLFKAHVHGYVGGRINTLMANYALLGAHVPSLQSPIFTKAVVKYPNLREFFFVQQVTMGIGVDFTSFIVQSPKQKDIRIPVEDETTWMLSGCYRWQTNHQYTEVNITQDSEFIVENKKNKSLSFFHKQIDEFSDFLSIALQGKQSPNAICFYASTEQGAPKFDLYYNVKQSSQCRCHLIGDSVSINRLGEIIQGWHKNYEEISPIYRYLEKSSFEQNGIGGSPEFLLVEFALEGYFKRFHNKAKTKGVDVQKCKDELNELLNYYADIELIKTLNINVNAVVATRDTYAHLRPKADQKDNEIKDAHTLWVVTEKLRILLLCCLLDNMGFTRQEIDANFKQAPMWNPEIYQNEFLFE